MERPEIGSVWRNKKRGTQYMVLNFVTLQCETGPDNEEAVIYMSRDAQGESHLWARPVKEFLDGRFEMISR